MTALPSVLCTASPSLALVKYWGKLDTELPNIPATTSIAVTLGGLESRTEVRLSEPTERGARSTEPGDQPSQTGARPSEPIEPDSQPGRDTLDLNGTPEDSPGIRRYFAELRRSLSAIAASRPQLFVDRFAERFWLAQSRNNFPTAAGIASSASGFAALTGACVLAALKPEHRTHWLASLGDSPPTAARGLSEGLDLGFLSAASRVGSGSASRSVFGGFTKLPRGAERAVCLAPAEFWPELRILVVQISSAQKPVSSREAMTLSKSTSPYFDSWQEDAEELARRAEEALLDRNLPELGRCMRLSYLRMFSTMFSSDPPVIYWKPQGLRILELCAELRGAGLEAWETMDAGPQVKILTTASQADRVLAELRHAAPETEILECSVGPGLRWELT